MKAGKNPKLNRWMPPSPAVRRLALGLAYALSIAGCASPESRKPQTYPGYQVTGVSLPRIPLDGTWEFQLNPPDRYWEAAGPTGAWRPIEVPGEPQMQGFNVINDKEFAYRRRIRIPVDFSGSRMFVRFEGVYGEARVWVNGHFLGNHLGSFTTWEREVTDWVKPGEVAEFTVGVTDRSDDISEASGYAKHCIGGILRSVSLLARPQTWVRDVRVETPLAADYGSATLRLTATVEFGADREAVLLFSLTDPQGRAVALSPSSLSVQAAKPSATLEAPVASPQLWDGEHPRLYTLTTRCVVHGEEVSAQTREVGFREIRLVGAKMLVNGRIVKLRGACRHDMHPLLGRVSTPEYELEDVLLAKEANINFFRTSHYPPTENFLRLCDEQGIYVEAESAVCFNQGWADEPYFSKLRNVTHDPAYTPWYLGQIREMVTSFRSHPSVIIWSAGNESRYGVNIARSLDLIRELDGSRPAIFSYSKTAVAEGDADRFDLCSIHYPSVEGMLDKDAYQTGMTHWFTDGRPSIGDEWAHVPCYCKDILKTDPGIQDFWGESLSRMWASCYDADDGIGGAIWGFVDETFQLPDRCVGYGPWGIVDTWRRRKPEFWNTKKAYSPVHLLATGLAIGGGEASLPIQNRYNHTNLDELTVRWSYQGRSGSAAAPDLPPRATGTLALPALAWRAGTDLRLDFIEPNGRLVDTYQIAVGHPVENAITRAEAPIRVDQTSAEILVSGANFSITFDKTTGLIREAHRLGRRILGEGPLLNVATSDEVSFLSRAPIQETLAEPFVPGSVRVESNPESVRILSTGKVGERSVAYDTSIHGNGIMTIDFTLTQAKTLPCQEVGLAFTLGEGFDSVSWHRESGLWTSYPDDHIGRLAGRASLFAPDIATPYRQRPVAPWAMDSRDYFLYGPSQSGISLTRDAKSCRAFIGSYVIMGEDLQVAVLGTGREGARIRELGGGNLALVVNTGWDYINLGWGNYERGLKLPPEYTGRITLDLGRGRDPDQP